MGLLGCSSAQHQGSGTGDAGAESDGGGASSGGSSAGKGGRDNRAGGGSSGSSGSTTGVAGDGANGGSDLAGSGGSTGGSNAGTGGSSAGTGGTGMSDSCDGVTCNTPPASTCTNDSQLQTYDASGTCQAGKCHYPSHAISCSCDNDACSSDPCLQIACNTPPNPVCKDPGALTTFASTGACDAGSCSYQATDTPCEFSCVQGACKPNPCDAVTCNDPPAATCKNPSTKTSYAPTGKCSGGVCSYESTDSTCDFGCDGGACQADPCTGVVCNQAPAASCSNPSELKTYDKIGACTNGECGYTSHVVACDCEAGACNMDPCKSVTCSSPPPPSCKDANTRTTYAANGTCSAGTCSYAPKDAACAFGCTGGECQPDPCTGVVCNDPPPAICKDPSTLTSYAVAGACSGGDCSYKPKNTACTFGCANGACKPDPCAAVSCNTPPAAVCKDSLTRTTFSAKGSCSAGDCSYTATDSSCAFGCEDGACQADPCTGVVCNQPPASTCKDEITKTTYSGACSKGSCSYTPADTACGSNKTCAGAGVCSVCKTDASCGSDCSACSGPTPRCADKGATSLCVACVSNDDCGGGTPKCNTATNTCGPAPSCIGLAKTCGATGDQDCCAASDVPGGDFNRNNDENHPATVSDFRLDNYEITVGRFRKFVDIYQNDSTVPFYYELPANQAALKTALKCDAKRQTWTDSAGNAAAESLPINCLDWYTAFAFCSWDGGRLPTEAQWNYAAAGGAQQRLYPWGSTAPDCGYANFFGASGGTAYCVAPGTGAVSRVGSYSALGNGLFGQSDLAGNVGEWMVEYFNTIYPFECVDCVDGTPSLSMQVRGGSYANISSALMTSTRVYAEAPKTRTSYIGARCVRIP